MSVWWWICPSCGRFREVNGPRQGSCRYPECSPRPEETRPDDKKIKTV